MNAIKPHLAALAFVVLPACFDPGADLAMESDPDGAESGMTMSMSEGEWEDSFDLDSGMWTFGDDPGAEQEGPGQWVYRDGDLVQVSDVSGPDTDVPSRGTYAVGGSFDRPTVAVEAGFTADDDGVAGVLCHATTSGDYVRLELDHETGIVRLVESRDGSFTILAESAAFTPPVQMGVERILEIECGDSYLGFVDDALVVEAPGSGSSATGVGLYASSIGDGPDGLRFHYIEIE